MEAIGLETFFYSLSVRRPGRQLRVILGDSLILEVKSRFELTHSEFIAAASSLYRLREDQPGLDPLGGVV